MTLMSYKNRQFEIQNYNIYWVKYFYFILETNWWNERSQPRGSLQRISARNVKWRVFCRAKWDYKKYIFCSFNRGEFMDPSIFQNYMSFFLNSWYFPKIFISPLKFTRNSRDLHPLFSLAKYTKIFKRILVLNEKHTEGIFTQKMKIYHWHFHVNDNIYQRNVPQ